MMLLEGLANSFHGTFNTEVLTPLWFYGYRKNISTVDALYTIIALLNEDATNDVVPCMVTTANQALDQSFTKNNEGENRNVEVISPDVGAVKKLIGYHDFPSQLYNKTNMFVVDSRWIDELYGNKYPIQRTFCLSLVGKLCIMFNRLYGEWYYDNIFKVHLTNNNTNNKKLIGYEKRIVKIHEISDDTPKDENCLVNDDNLSNDVKVHKTIDDTPKDRKCLENDVNPSNDVKVHEISDDSPSDRNCLENSDKPSNDVKVHKTVDDTPKDRKCLENDDNPSNDVKVHEISDDSPSDRNCLENSDNPSNDVKVYKTVDDTPKDRNCLENDDNPSNDVKAHEISDDSPNNRNCLENSDNPSNDVEVYKTVDDTPKDRNCLENDDNPSNDVKVHEILDDSPKDRNCVENSDNPSSDVKVYKTVDDTPKDRKCLENDDNPSNDVKAHEISDDSPNDRNCLENSDNPSNDVKVHKISDDTPKDGNSMEYSDNQSNDVNIHAISDHSPKDENCMENDEHLDQFTGIPSIILPEECVIMVKHIKSQNEIFCRVFDPDIAKKEAQMQISIAEYCLNLTTAHTPAINEVCCVMFEKNYARAFVQSVGETTANVFFIDYGNSACVGFDDIRPYQMETIDLPSLAIKFQLDLSALFNDAIDINVLKKRLENRIFRVSVVSRPVSHDDTLTLKVLDKCGEDVLNHPDFFVKSANQINRIADATTTTTTPTTSTKNYTVSSLPSGVHPLEAVDLKMDISTLSSTVVKLCITHIESPCLFYGARIDDDVIMKHNQMRIDLSKICTTSNSEFNIKAGVLCACRDLEVSSSWQRGIATEVTETECTVFFIDTGATSQVALDFVKPLSKDFKSLPSQAIPMKLMSIKALNSEEEWSEDAIQFFKETLNGKTVRILPKFKEGVITNVKLKLDSNNKRVDTLLEDAGYAMICTPTNKDNEKIIQNRVNNIKYIISSLTPDIHPLESVRLKMNISMLPTTIVQLRITHVESPSLFHGVFIDNDILADIGKMLVDLSTACAGTNNEDFVGSNNDALEAGVLCACKGNGLLWQRGIITEVTETECTVFFIDMGLTFNVPINSVKPLGREFNAINAQAIPMKLMTVKPLHGENEWSEDAMNFFKELLLGNIVRVLPTYKEGLVTNVKLKLLPENEVVDKLLESSGYAEIYEPVIPHENKEIESSITQAQGEKKSVPLGWISQVIDIENVDAGDSIEVLITCVASPRLFYGRIHDEDKSRKVVEIATELKKLYEGKSVENTNLKTGNLCAVKHQDDWNRGYIVDIQASSSKCIVWLLDHGMREVVDLGDLCALPESMCKYPAQALTMQIHNLVPIANNRHSDATVNKFKSLVINRVMKVDVMKKNGLIHRVIVHDAKTGVDISDLLVRQGLANYVYGKAPRHAAENDLLRKLTEREAIKKSAVQCRENETNHQYHQNTHDEIPSYRNVRLYHHDERPSYRQKVNNKQSSNERNLLYENRENRFPFNGNRRNYGEGNR